jgi:hypothetical protein
VSSTLSIDLACTSYEKFGICRIDGIGRPPWQVRFLKPGTLGLEGSPAPAACAEAIARYCAAEGVEVLLLDGPQGWKDPKSVLRHSRRCERELACPAKTGTEGKVKPANYRRFVEFSIGLFTTLVGRWGMTLLARSVPRPRAGVLLVESFPHAAWKGLGLDPLPAKHRCRLEEIDRRADELYRKVGIDPAPVPSHDDLQAFAAGIAGPALAAVPAGERPGRPKGCALYGVDPERSDRGYYVEGLIAVPVPWSE